MTAPNPTDAEQQLIAAMRADNAIWTERRMHAENTVGISNVVVKSDLHTAGHIEHNVVERWADRKARKAVEKATAKRAAEKGRVQPQDVTTNTIMERAQAKAAGCTRYFTARRCLNGHLSERYTVSGLCVLCQREQATSVRLRAKKQKAA